MSQTPKLGQLPVSDAHPEETADRGRREAIRRLMALGVAVPTAVVLIDMKTNNAFAEPGT